MKLGDSNLWTSRIVAVVALVLAAKCSFGEFPIPVGTKEKDFIVKFKGEILSWKNLTQLLRRHNITVPDERVVLDALLRDKNYPSHSCKKKRRCSVDERRFPHKTCFNDEACKTFGDCCLNFQSCCDETDNNTSFENMTCGDVNKEPWTGVIMKSTCSSRRYQNSNDCQTVRKLDLVLERELPVFDWTQNVTYRSIACARCNNAGNLSFWGLHVSCTKTSESIPAPVNITTVKKFLKDHPDCLWKYAPRNGKQQYKDCVLHDAACASNPNKLPGLSIVKELCSLYSMLFSTNEGLRYRNPHCALCHPSGKPESGQALSENMPIVPPLSILLDVRSSIPDPKYSNSNSHLISDFKGFNTHEKNSPHVFIMGAPLQDHNLTSQVLNCSSTTSNCTVLFPGYNCANFTLVKNQSKQLSVNKSHFAIIITHTKFLQEKNAMKLEGNSVYILCPENKVGPSGNDGQLNKEPKLHYSAVLIYVTFTGTLLSIISLCFLLCVYFCFTELRNLPGKCLISLSVALLCYQAVLLGAVKPRKVDAVCKAVAIFLHFFLLAAFSWMSVVAFDTASTFTVKVTVQRRQPSDVRMTFLKYCIVGWGVPAVIAVLCSVLDITETFHFGYGNAAYCWISDKKVLAVAVVTPVCLSLVFNSFCVLKSTCAIRHLQQGANQVTNNRSQASLTRICIQLTAVMGLTWILGILANWNQTSFLQYPSTVLNSMQGFFITLCFTTTKKVRCLLKDRLFKRWNRTAAPSDVM